MRILTVLLLLGLAVPALADGLGFRTPSGNIYCNGSLQGGAELTCLIINREPGSAPAGIGDCPAGRELSVHIDETGPVAAQCGRPSGRLSTYTDIADYGVTGRFGRITCLSQRSGFTCGNADGRGFTLSRRAQTLF